MLEFDISNIFMKFLIINYSFLWTIFFNILISSMYSFYQGKSDEK